MLDEVLVSSTANRKWYRSKELNLTIELDTSGLIETFQLEYRHQNKAFQIDWCQGQAKIFIVDDGESRAMRNDTPLIIGENLSLSPAVTKQFEHEAKYLPSTFRETVLKALTSLPQTKA